MSCAAFQACILTERTKERNKQTNNTSDTNPQKQTHKQTSKQTNTQTTELRKPRAPRPDEKNIVYAKKILEATFLCGKAGQATRASRIAVADDLLRHFNGDWKDAAHITHHCKYGCCKTKAESIAKSYHAITKVIFAGRPHTPCISKWTSCAKSARYFMSDSQTCGFAFCVTKLATIYLFFNNY